MLWVKTQPCLMAGVWPDWPCSGVVEADHAGMRGVGRKCPDIETIPLCHEHHHGGRFPRHVTKPYRRAWLDAAVLYTQGQASRGSTPLAVQAAVPAVSISTTHVRAAQLEMATRDMGGRDQDALAWWRRISHRPRDMPSTPEDEA